MTIDQLLDKLIHDVEASVHAFYRGDMRNDTQRVRAGALRNSTRDAILAAVAESGLVAGSFTTTPREATSLSPEEAVAATRCVMAWLPMGGSNAAAPGARCVPAARELAPTWGERERARLALKRSAG